MNREIHVGGHHAETMPGPPQQWQQRWWPPQQRQQSQPPWQRTCKCMLPLRATGPCLCGSCCCCCCCCLSPAAWWAWPRLPRNAPPKQPICTSLAMPLPWGSDSSKLRLPLPVLRAHTPCNRSACSLAGSRGGACKLQHQALACKRREAAPLMHAPAHHAQLHAPCPGEVGWGSARGPSRTQAGI